MKKILFVLPKLSLGGAEKSLIMLLNSISSRFPQTNVDLLLFRPEGAFLSDLPQNVHLLEPPEEIQLLFPSKNDRTKISLGKRIKFTFLRYFSTLVCKFLFHNKKKQPQKRWIAFYRHYIPDLPNHYDFACSFLDGEASYYVIDKVCSQKKVMWNQNVYSSLGTSKKNDAYYFSKFDYLIAISPTCKSVLLDNFPFLEPKTRIIEPIISHKYLEKLSTVFFPPEMSKTDVMPVIVSVGRLTNQKGFDLAIDAALLMRKHGYLFKWLIIGNGELYSFLNKKVHSNDLDDFVLLLGEKKNPYPYIFNCTIFAQTSRFEGNSLVLSEAKSLDKPILVTNYSTVNDQIKNNFNGIVVDMNSKSIANGLEGMLVDSNLRNDLAKNLLTEDESGKCEERILGEISTLFNLEENGK